MKLSVLIGQDLGGSWEAIALPDKTVDEQKALMKRLIVAGGVLESKKGKAKQYQRIQRMDSFSKRYSFRHFKQPSEFKAAASDAATEA